MLGWILSLLARAGGTGSSSTKASKTGTRWGHVFFALRGGASIVWLRLWFLAHLRQCAGFQQRWLATGVEPNSDQGAGFR